MLSITLMLNNKKKNNSKTQEECTVYKISLNKKTTASKTKTQHFKSFVLY